MSNERTTRWVLLAMRELDLSAQSAVAVLNKHPEFSTQIHSLIGRLGNLHSALRELVTELNADAEYAPKGRKP